MSAVGHAVVRPLMKEARDRQRRRRRTVGSALALSLGIAALVVVVTGPGHSSGGPPGLSATGTPSSSHRTEPALTARYFAKYRLGCYTLRQAAIPGAGHCKPESVVLSFKTHSVVIKSSPAGSTLARPAAGVSARDLGGVVFGMSKQQVQRRLGKPTTTHGPCWQYELLPTAGAAAAGVSEVDVGVCFYEGRAAYMS